MAKVRITELPKFGSGGKSKQNPPIYVDSPNDPRYKAYRDSLNAYNRGEQYYNIIQNDKLQSSNGIITKSLLDQSKKDLPYNITKESPISTYSYIEQDDSVDNNLPKGVKDNNVFTVESNRYKKPIQPVKVGQPFQKIPFNHQYIPEEYHPQQVDTIPLDIPKKGWYSNSVGVPIGADNDEVSNKLYNEDGTKKYEMGGSIKKKVRITELPQAKYGAAVSNDIQDQNTFDNRWNPGSYQGAIGVNPDPSPFARTGNTLPEAEPGEGNIKIEKEEQVLGNFTPDGLPSLLNAKTGTHESGNDKEASVSDGAFIFSDTKSLKIKDPEILKQFNQTKPATPAQIAKQYQLQKFTKTIADPKSDNVSKKTAELMVNNYTEKLNQLADIQEGIKNHMGIENSSPMQKYGGLPTFAKGGPGDKTYKGDDVGDLGNYGNASLVPDYSGDNNPHNHPGRNYGQPVNNTPNNAPWGWNGVDPVAPSYDYHDLGIPELPGMPDTVAQPNNMQTPSNPDTRFGSYSATDVKKPDATNVPFTSPTPDKYGMLNSIYNAATIHKYPMWEAPISAVAPNTVYEDPTRAIAALNEQSNASGYNVTLSGNNKAVRANQMAYQNADQIANVLGSTSNHNAQIANQASRETTDISNRLQQQQAQRLSDIYKGNVIGSQQYDNAQREARKAITQSAQESWLDRQKYDTANTTNPLYYYDPRSGKSFLKGPEAQATIQNELKKLEQGQGFSPDKEERASQYYKKLIQLYGEDNSGYLLKEARRAVGLDQHETQNIDPITGRALKAKISGIPYGQEQKYGGKLPKKQFGGFDKQQLKKFTSK